MSKYLETKEKRFCSKCGSVMELRDREGFDPETGEKNFEQVCSNLHCIDGCFYHGGHTMKKIGGWLRYEEYCTRCGGKKVYGEFFTHVIKP